MLKQAQTDCGEQQPIVTATQPPVCRGPWHSPYPHTLTQMHTTSTHVHTHAHPGEVCDYTGIINYIRNNNQEWMNDLLFFILFCYFFLEICSIFTHLLHCLWVRRCCLFWACASSGKKIEKTKMIAVRKQPHGLSGQTKVCAPCCLSEESSDMRKLGR